MKIIFCILLLIILPTLADDSKIGSSAGCNITDYKSAKSSDYILPYEVAEDYTISQGNCGGVTHTIRPSGEDMRYAYDFDLPIGAKILASRGGKVINVEDFYSNITSKVEEINFIFIQHKDKSVAIYLHLSPNGSLVDIGQKVNQGDVIGIAGNSGFTGGTAHLHFDVRERDFEDCNLSGLDWSNLSTYRMSKCKTIPITFKNASPLDTPLLESKEYKAEEF